MTMKKLSTYDYVLNNFIFIKNYLDLSIRAKKLLYLESFEYKAKEEFRNLPLNDNETAINQWSNWIVNYVSSREWERCKTAIRQHRFMQKKRYDYKTFRIPRRLSYQIEYYASLTGLTKFAAMQQAIDAAIEALGANDHKLINHEIKKGGGNHK